MFEYKVGIEETMSRAGVNQCREWQASESIGGERNGEGVGSRKSRHVESNLICRMNGVSTVILGGINTFYPTYCMVFTGKTIGRKGLTK
jgi:hypothetical protein